MELGGFFCASIKWRTARKGWEMIIFGPENRMTDLIFSSFPVHNSGSNIWHTPVCPSRMGI